jgi:hypothetical protein
MGRWGLWKPAWGGDLGSVLSFGFSVRRFPIGQLGPRKSAAVDATIELREELRRRGLPDHILGVDRPQLESSKRFTADIYGRFFTISSNSTHV